MRKYAWMAALLLVAGCADSTLYAGTAGLAGVSDVVRVGNLVFITSANRSELRVLDTLPNISQNQKDSDYVRAPNPLKYLSIPVQARPVSLHTDAWYDAAGAEKPGRYVIVRGAGASGLSIVGAAREQLVELAPLKTAGPVTAVTAQGAEGADSILFYAESVEGAPHIQRVLLPAAADQVTEAALEAAPRRVEVKDAAGNSLQFLGADGQPENIVSLLVLPRANSQGNLQLAVATRNVQGAAGSSYLLTLDAQGLQELPDVPRVTLDFGGPVRALFTHAAGRHVPDYYNAEAAAAAAGTPVVPAGARIFGVLDEAFCPSPLQCGLVAVDTVDGVLADGLPQGQRGQRSKDRSGRTMVPLNMGNSLIQGLTFASGMPIDGNRWYELGGIVTASDGHIALFDAGGLQHIDIRGQAAPRAGSLTLYAPDGTLYPDATVRDRTLLPLASSLAGSLPNLYHLVIGKVGDANVPAHRTSSIIDINDNAAEVLKNVRVGDQVELLNDDQPNDPNRGTFTSCADPLRVVAISQTSGTLTLSAPIPDTDATEKECNAFSVRPATFEVLKDGVIQNQYIRLTYQGTLPGLTAQPIPSAGATSVSVPADLAGRVRPGDFLQFTKAGAACASAADVKVVAMVAGATPQDASTVTLSASMPTECDAYTVRAGTEKPWVMTGTAEPYFGRVAPEGRIGEDIIRGTPFFHPPGLQDDTPAVDFYFTLPPELVPQTGVTIEFAAIANFVPFAFKQSTSTNSTIDTRDFYLPGGVVYVPELREPLVKDARVYVAYPSASALLEFKPGSDPDPATDTVYGIPYR